MNLLFEFKIANNTANNIQQQWALGLAQTLPGLCPVMDNAKGHNLQDQSSIQLII